MSALKPLCKERKCSNIRRIFPQQTKLKASEPKQEPTVKIQALRMKVRIKLIAYPRESNISILNMARCIVKPITDSGPIATTTTRFKRKCKPFPGTETYSERLAILKRYPIVSLLGTSNQNSWIQTSRNPLFKSGGHTNFLLLAIHRHFFRATKLMDSNWSEVLYTSVLLESDMSRYESHSFQPVHSKSQ